MEGSQGTRLLKRDVFGTVERLDDAHVRRVASGSRAPLSRVLAGRLLERERRALERLGGLDGVPSLVRTESSSDGDVLVRTFVAGEPLSAATSLPENFFDELDALVAALHARGVCHNDLHKEQNVIVAADGYPWLVDFQLASVHAGAGWLHARRAREDLRHVEKHRRRYTRDGRGPNGVRTYGRGSGSKRSPLALVWRRLGKPVYNFVARLVAPDRESEVRRPSSGPWPVWSAPIAPRSHKMSSR